MSAVVDILLGYGLAAVIASCTVLLMGLWHGNYVRGRPDRLTRELNRTTTAPTRKASR